MTEPARQENELDNVPVGSMTGGLSHLSVHNGGVSVETSEATATKSYSRRGYWDMMSLFHTTNKDSTSQSGTHLRS